MPGWETVWEVFQLALPCVWGCPQSQALACLPQVLVVLLERLVIRPLLAIGVGVVEGQVLVWACPSSRALESPGGRSGWGRSPVGDDSAHLYGDGLEPLGVGGDPVSRLHR